MSLLFTSCSFNTVLGLYQRPFCLDQLHLSVLFSISCHCYKIVPHFLCFHPLFTSWVHSWVRFAGSHLHRAGKSFFSVKNMEIFIAKAVTEWIFGEKDWFCLELAEALFSSKCRQACFRHFQMMSSSSFLYFQLQKLFPCVLSLSACFSSQWPPPSCIGLTAAAL